MKRWFCAGAVLLYLLPSVGTDISRLHPVGLLYVRRAGASVEIRTDTGDSGTGPDVQSAMQDLRDSCHGEIFTETVEKLIVSDTVLAAQLRPYLRPSVEVVQGRGEIDPEQAARFLTAHSSGRRLMDAGKSLPVLTESGGKYHIEETE